MCDYRPCSQCEGSGTIAGPGGEETCPNCGGSGEIETDEDDLDFADDLEDRLDAALAMGDAADRKHKEKRNGVDWAL